MRRGATITRSISILATIIEVLEDDLGLEPSHDAD